MDTTEAKARNAFDTSKIFARDPDGTVLHDLYQTALGREVELGGLATWKGLLKTRAPVEIAAMIAIQPEFVADHAAQTDSQYVTDLIRHGHGRAPTAGELGTAVGRLGAGLNRAALMLEIASNPETIARWNSDDMNEPPVLAALSNVSVHENQSVSASLRGTDPDRSKLTYGLVSGPAGATVDPVSGLFSLPGQTGPSRNTVTLSVTDPGGLGARRSFTIDVSPTGPILTASGPGTAFEGASTYVSLSGASVAPGAAVTGWTVNWGDGTAAQSIPGGSVQPGHVYAEPGAPPPPMAATPPPRSGSPSARTR